MIVFLVGQDGLLCYVFEGAGLDNQATSVDSISRWHSP